MSGGSSVRVLKRGHFTLEGINGTPDLPVELGVFIAERSTLILEEGIHDGAFPWLLHVLTGA